MKKHQNTIGKSDEWLTPPNIIQALGSFDLDPASPINRPWDTAKKHYTIEDNGLLKKWEGRIWLNPPFNRYHKYKWMKLMSEHNNGIMLIPAALETNDFKNYVLGKCSGILFLDKRPHFHFVNDIRATANSGCTICLISYGKYNLESLIDSKLGVVMKQI